MQKLNINDSIFIRLKNDSNVNKAALQNLIDGINRNSFSKKLVTQMSSHVAGAVDFRLATQKELAGC